MYISNARKAKIEMPFLHWLSINTRSKMSSTDIENLTPKKFGSRREIVEPEKLQQILFDILAAGDAIQTKSDLAKALLAAKRRHRPRTGVNNWELLQLYRSECTAGTFEFNARYEELFQTKGFRSQSGVLVIAIFTSPFPETQGTKQSFSCEYDCYYCPAEPNQPRSYLISEPGVARANANGFDPVDQFNDRANMYVQMGHPVDKIELLVLGGTWSSYPADYQETFLRDVYFAANVFGLKEPESRARKSLQEEIRTNETANVRIIGLTLETRPDRVTAIELQRMRSFGVTRIQMGVQHTHPRMLERINRRCSPNHVIRALRLAKDNCFKVDIHLMPDLPAPLKPGVPVSKGTFDPEDIDTDFSVLDADRQMFDTVINHPDWQADQWKIYPCEVTKWTRIEEDYKRGSYRPYGHQTNPKEWTPLFELLVDVMSKVKPWVRLNRVIRDIPSHEILGGI